MSPLLALAECRRKWEELSSSARYNIVRYAN